MTPLASKATRDSQGIDTYERGLLYASLLLVASNTHPNNPTTNQYSQAVTLTFKRGSMEYTEGEEETIVNQINPLINIKAYLPYDKQACFRTGGNYFEYVQSFNNIDPNPLLISIQPTNKGQDNKIATEPSWVNSLEKYFLWTAMNIDSQSYYDPGYIRRAEITIADNSSGNPFIQVDATLPNEYHVFLRQRNLLSAVVGEIVWQSDRI